MVEEEDVDIQDVKRQLKAEAFVKVTEVDHVVKCQNVEQRPGIRDTV